VISDARYDISSINTPSLTDPVALKTLRRFFNSGRNLLETYTSLGTLILGS